VHVLVVPKKHIENISYIDKENDKEILSDLFIAVNEIVKKIGIDKTGYRVEINNGEDANQEVKHLHLHILGGEKL